MNQDDVVATLQEYYAAFNTYDVSALRVPEILTRTFPEILAH
jgi:hypothetical protein